MGDLNQRFPRYSKLLYLYPVVYRKQYGNQMLQTLADMLDDPERLQPAVWSRVVFDFPFSVIKQQISYTGETMSTTMPNYVKRNGIIGAVLLTPFFVFIILSSIIGNRLQNSGLWHDQVLFVWLILLPTLAAIINLLALLRWVRSGHQAKKQSSWRALLDIRQNWPVLGIVVLSICILGLVFFHDSVHCVTGNPIRELHNPHQTWQCIQRG